MIASLFAGGRIVDAIIILTAAEAVALLLWRRWTGSGVAARLLIPNLLSGGCLLLALRAALAGDDPRWIAACLLGSLVAHVVDLRGRWRGSDRQISPPGASTNPCRRRTADSGGRSV